jgi:transcriptional regulator with XRE-family HTH domain
MIEAKQIRAARALLEWSQQDLAKATGLATSSIKNIESDSTAHRRASIQLIANTLDDAGIEFLAGTGVRLHNDILALHSGRNATSTLFDTLYQSAHASPDRDICIFGFDEDLARDLDGQDSRQHHIARLQTAGITERILVAQGNRSFVNAPDSYRWLPTSYFNKSAPIFIAGDRVAIHFGTLKRRAITIHLRSLAQHMRQLFNFVWDHAQMPQSVAANGATVRVTGAAANATRPART